MGNKDRQMIRGGVPVEQNADLIGRHLVGGDGTGIESLLVGGWWMDGSQLDWRWAEETVDGNWLAF
jgi:hypothetical protein